MAQLQGRGEADCSGQCQVSLAPLFYLSRTLGPGAWNRKERDQWRRMLRETVL